MANNHGFPLIGEIARQSGLVGRQYFMTANIVGGYGDPTEAQIFMFMLCPSLINIIIVVT